MKNKKLIMPIILVFLLLFSGFSKNNNSSRNHTDSIVSGGLKRTFLVHIPTSFDKSESIPLLIVLHGGGGTGRDMVKLTQGGFERLSDQKGFIVVYPNGIGKHWNDGRTGDETGHEANNENIDDTGFISALIDYFINKMNIDPKRVYVTGMSNGAIMSYCLACSLYEKIAAIAPVAGNIPLNLVRSCSPSRPVSVLAINSINDPLVHFEGGEVTGPFGQRTLGKLLSTAESVKFWTKNNRCSITPVITYEPDKDPYDGTRIKKEFYTNGKNNSEVILYTVEGGGHTWPGGNQYLAEWIIGKTSRDLNACEVIWAFFEKHSFI